MKKLTMILIMGLITAFASPLFAGVMRDGFHMSAPDGDPVCGLEFNTGDSYTGGNHGMPDGHDMHLPDCGPGGFDGEENQHNPAPVPEPATLLLLGSGLLGLAGIKKRASR